MWRCITRLENSTECRARTVNENALTNAFVIAVNKLIATNDSYIEVLQKNIATVIEAADPDSGESIQARIDELQQQILEKSDRNEDFDAEAQEILRLRQQKENASPNDISSEDMERIRKLQTFITKMPSAILDFDESLVKHLLEKITVFEDKLEFEFKSSITIVIEN